MLKIRTLILAMCFLVMVGMNTVAFADDKTSDEIIDPVWIHLEDETEPSNHNPNGTLVVYGMDAASAKEHSSNKDTGFWLAKITKAKNEIELTYIRIAKDKRYYKAVQRMVFYLDGTFKSAENFKGAVEQPMSGNEVFYSAPEVYKNYKANPTGSSNMDMPELPMGFNRMKLMNPKNGFEKWLCLLDNRSTGVDSNNRNKLTLVTYAYNVADRVYYKGITYVDRTGDTSYNITGGNSYLYTFEDKLLSEKNTKKGYLISEQDADKTVRHKFMFYKAERNKR